jgi:type III secretory pathway component EscS
MYQICIDALVLIMLISGVPMVTVAVCSGVVALLQAVTQIQEQSCIHLARWIGFALTAFLAAPYAADGVLRLFLRALELLALAGAR